MAEKTKTKQCKLASPDQLLTNFLPDAPAAPRVRNSVEIPLLGGECVGSVFSFDNLLDSSEHVAIGLGTGRGVEVPLVRVTPSA